MNIYSRTFAALKPYWRKLSTASFSAALHAVLTGVMLWMIGPLLMTLFQVNNAPILGGGVNPGGEYAVESPANSSSNAASVAESWIVTIKETIKDWIDAVVTGENRGETLFNFCLLILAVALLKNVFYYIQGFFMVWVQQSIMRDFRDRLFDKYQRLSFFRSNFAHISIKI